MVFDLSDVTESEKSYTTARMATTLDLSTDIT